MKTIKNNYFIEERKKVIEKIASIEIDIKVLERTDPKMIVAQRPAMKDEKGKVMS